MTAPASGVVPVLPPRFLREASVVQDSETVIAGDTGDADSDRASAAVVTLGDSPGAPDFFPTGVGW